MARRTNRRQFLRDAGVGITAGGAALIFGKSLLAAPSHVLIGLQLYTVREELKKDLPGTLHAVAAIGYRTVELGEDDYPAKVLRDAIAASGLTCLGGLCQTHNVAEQPDATIERAKTLGYRYLSCAWPQGLDSSFHVNPARTGNALTLDDYRRHAELFNRFGEKCRQAGLQLVYHSHNFEFQPIDGVVPYELLMQHTDPKLFQIELDTYWVARAGKDPVDFFHKYPGRVATLHIKDMKPVKGPTFDVDSGRDAFTEVGSGTMDWKRILAAADAAGVKHAFTEQDAGDRPPIESAKISFEYLQKLQFT
jgi:sugar phosphate isomerase/epimerase